MLGVQTPLRFPVIFGDFCTSFPKELIEENIDQLIGDEELPMLYWESKKPL